MLNKAMMVMILCAAFPCASFGGNLDATASPSAGSGMPSLADIYNQLNTGATPTTPGTFQEPTSGPTAGTGKSLNDIKAKLPVPDNTHGLATTDAPAGKTFWGLRTNSTWGPQTGSNSNVVNTASGDAAASDITCGKKAWVKGIEITGTAAILCPGQDTQCATRTCNSMACSFSYATAGTIVSFQTAGDCHQNQCDGSGNIVSVIDNTDVPNDDNQCTLDLCTNGVPSHPPAPVGTSCNQNGGTYCNGMGACV